MTPSLLPDGDARPGEDPPRPLPCPRCPGTLLGALDVPPAPRIDACPSCRGIWCTRARLPALLGVAEDHPGLAWYGLTPTRTERACPACATATLDQLSPGEGVTLARCTTCRGVWLEGGALPRLKEALAALAPATLRPRPRTVPPPPPPAGSGDAADDDAEDGDAESGERFAYDVPLVNASALPIALGASLLVGATGLRFLVETFVNMTFHELGHAAVAWFSGRYAVPLPFITFAVTEEQSVVVALALAAFLGAGLVLGLRERRRYLVSLAGGGLLLQASLTLLLPQALVERWITFAGCAGEFVFGALLVVSFYYRLPDRMRWDFWRYVALAVGAAALSCAFLRWHQIAANLALLPLGSALGGAEDPEGDMNKLLGWGWSGRQIARTYLGLGYACLTVIAAHYGVFLARARMLALKKARTTVVAARGTAHGAAERSTG
ncbi:zf-TFIIB domain-containing protein [Chondromyces apiculatus]|uniref:Transcription factor zinc-finger domain-containing protein n=1 Tax=Chondromyces apiculatus DSM 436 TaxID=1192034 RepID=A0A017TA18_9BACT|nr:zf-TFIIB domain-containing protein [Chondromyces apiculatus]EYF06113.1 Hypothetical protein CAP_2303 [Chondromyces apiculatus DSM 436]